MKLLKLCVLLISLFISDILFAQLNWGPIKPNQYEMSFIWKDTSLIGLRNIILDNNSDPMKYLAAAKYLAYYHKESEQQFLLDNLNTQIDSTNTPDKIYWSWSKFYTDKLIRGYLGDSNAIAGMDTIFRNQQPFNNFKEQAIANLAEIGIFNREYFDYSKTKLKLLLPYYAYLNEYKEEIKTIYLNDINNAQDNTEIHFILTYRLSRVDKEAAIQICWDKINQTSGVERQTFFYDLLSINPENEIQYTKQILLLEQDEYYRHKYFPDIIMINLGLRSTKFLSLDWVSFLEDYKNQESSEIILSMIDSFRKNFYPQKPDSSATILEMIDHLINMTDSVFIYGWIGDMIFKDELINYVQNARTKLQGTDSLGCGEEIRLYKNILYQVYKDSLNPDSRFVNIEGLNFLYWNAQYILDRLPEIPITLPPDIEVINPAMSLVNPGAFTMAVKGTGFTTNSVVYFNGSSRATTFISDSVLNAQILSTDVSAAGNYPVWVSDGTTNSDTLIYKVVSTLPQPVRPVLECVRNNGDGTYTAFFGYKNDNNVSVYIPVGNKNKFTPTPQDRGQTKVFLPGRKYRVFTVNFNGSNLVWTLNGRTSTASSNSAPCN